MACVAVLPYLSLDRLNGVDDDGDRAVGQRLERLLRVDVDA